MTLAIMQPYLFPYIGYFQLMQAVDKFVVYDDVAYIKKGWVNRNRILVNKSDNIFTVPLQNGSQNVLIKDILLARDEKWLKKFYRTLEMAYKKAPYYEEALNIIEQVFAVNSEHITDLQLKNFELIKAYLDIEVEIVKTSQQYDNTHLSGQHRILDICLQEKADHYINPTGGQEIYTRELFTSNNVKLNFIQSEKIEYSQFGNEFVPWLSIIDVLMFNSKEEIKEMLNQYKLI
jgi:hypothetical protein